MAKAHAPNYAHAVLPIIESESGERNEVKAIKQVYIIIHRCNSVCHYNDILL